MILYTFFTAFTLQLLALKMRQYDGTLFPAIVNTSKQLPHFDFFANVFVKFS